MCDYSNFIVTEPLGYLEMIRLMGSAKKILTDSGGIQKRAYMLEVPCITLREKTEWVETVKEGWNVLVGADREKIMDTINCFNPNNNLNDIFGRFVAKIITTIINKSRL